LKGGVSQGRWDGRTLRHDRDANGQELNLYDDINSSRDQTSTLGAKYTTVLDNGHSLVAGSELENNQRSEQHTEADDSGDDLSARAFRVAVYAQDEWSLTPQWALHLGLRWEGIETR